MWVSQCQLSLFQGDRRMRSSRFLDHSAFHDNDSNLA